MQAASEEMPSVGAHKTRPGTIRDTAHTLSDIVSPGPVNGLRPIVLDAKQGARDNDTCSGN